MCFLISCVISCVEKRSFLNYNLLYTGINFISVAVAVSMAQVESVFEAFEDSINGNLFNHMATG